MIILLTTLHVLVCVLLVLAVLLQSGKGGGLAASLGGGLGSSSILGGRSAATFLSNATTILATAFMVSCLAQAAIVRAQHVAPTTATERLLQEQGSVPTPGPVPIGDGLLPGEASPSPDQASPSPDQASPPQ
jgi:preprotein translocase subunit SecG